jgi:hypothetical protein
MDNSFEIVNDDIYSRIRVCELRQDRLDKEIKAILSLIERMINLITTTKKITQNDDVIITDYTNLGSSVLFGEIIQE